MAEASPQEVDARRYRVSASPRWRLARAIAPSNQVGNLVTSPLLVAPPRTTSWAAVRGVRQSHTNEACVNCLTRLPTVCASKLRIAMAIACISPSNVLFLFSNHCTDPQGPLPRSEQRPQASTAAYIIGPTFPSALACNGIWLFRTIFRHGMSNSRSESLCHSGSAGTGYVTPQTIAFSL